MLKSGVRISPVRIEARASSTWVRQRTQLISAIWGHLTEYGWIAPKGPSHVAMLTNLIEEEEMASSLPKAAHAMFRLMLDLLAELNGEVADLDRDVLPRRGRKNQMYSSCLEHAFMIWFRSANSHTGPQLHRCTIRGRTDGSIRLRADLLQKSLASRGASTDEYAS